jgi:hypothetical protein
MHIPLQVTMLLRRGEKYMKKHIDKFLIIVIISLIIVLVGKGSTKAQETMDLLTIASVVQGEEIKVDEWSLYAREKIVISKDQRDVTKVETALKNQFPTWKWTHSSDHQQSTTTAVSTEPSPYEEKLTIVSTPTKQHIHAYVIYEVTGKAWDAHTERFLKQESSKRISDIFRGNPTIFSCISATLDGKMKSTLSSRINGLLTAFKADEIESIRENNFISVSASSQLFEETLKRNHDNMNLQLAVRSQGLGSDTTLVIGTPIITIEY